MSNITRATSSEVPEPQPGTWSNCLVAGGFAYIAGMTARGSEVFILVIPSGPAGGRFRELVRRVLRDVPLLSVAGGDDILFYREAAQVPFADLEQLGPIAREAYAQLIRREHFTPHARADIVFRSM